MIEKTVFISNNVTNNSIGIRFVRGFLDTSHWKVTDSTEASVAIYLIERATGDEFGVEIMGASWKNASISLMDRTKVFCISMPRTAVFAQYLSPPLHDCKSFQDYLNRKNLSSAYDVGYEFGVFAADAINEESWQQKKDGFNAASSIIDELEREDE